MTDSLKKKTVSGLIWNAIDKVGFQIIVLVVGIITARLLSPKDFGLIGALTVFSVLSGLLVESGFTAALVRRDNNTDEDYTTVFFFNLALSIFLYTILYFSAPYIALYFRMPELTALARFIFLSLILTSCGLVQNIILTKDLSFRLLTISNILSVLLAGIITIVMVLNGLTYWALAWQLVLQSAFRTLFFWIFSPWKLSQKLNLPIIREIFNFSALLLITNLIVTGVKYIYNIVIGRFYTVQSLGFYSQAFKYQQIPSSIISTTINGVAYPVLSKLKDNPERQLLYIRKILRIIAFMVFPSMVVLYALSTELVTIVLTEKWLPSVPYFKLLLIAGAVYPLHVFYLMLLLVNGFVKRNFILEIIRNGLILSSLLLCLASIQKMLIGFLIATLISYTVDLFFLRSIFKFKVSDQLKDVFPYFIIALGMYFVITLLGMIDLNLYLRTSIQVLGGLGFYFLSLYLLGSKVLQDTLSLFIK